MALVVEDGTGVAGAESFITVAEYDTLHTNIFAHNEHGSTPQKEAALRRSWYYLKSLTWGEDYPFPTLGGEIPADVKLAQSLLAHYELDNVNGLAPSVVPGQQKVLNRVGEIGWQAMGQAGAEAQRAVVTMAADLLKPYLVAANNFLLRA
jgi:hypothetical protein